MPVEKEQNARDLEEWNRQGFKLFYGDAELLEAARDESGDPGPLETPAAFHAAVARAVELQDAGMLEDIALEMFDRARTPVERVSSQYLLAALSDAIRQIPQPVPGRDADPVPQTATQ